MLSELGSVRSGECETVVLALCLLAIQIPIYICQNLQAKVLLGSLARGELLPCFGTLTDDVHGVLLVLALAREGELILGLAVRDLVNAEPLIRSTQQARQVALDILDVVELGRQRVVYVDDHDLPVGLSLVEESHDTEDLDLDDIAGL
jgi:hypothetical protein